MSPAGWRDLGRYRQARNGAHAQALLGNTSARERHRLPIIQILLAHNNLSSTARCPKVSSGFIRCTQSPLDRLNIEVVPPNWRCPMSTRLEVADIFRCHSEAYRQAHQGHLGRVERRVMSAPHRLARWAYRGVPGLRNDACGLQFLPQPALPEVPRLGGVRLASRGCGRTHTGALFPSGVHAARRDRGGCLPKQGGRLRHSVQDSRRNTEHDRRRSQATRRRDRPHHGAP